MKRMIILIGLLVMSGVLGSTHAAGPEVPRQSLTQSVTDGWITHANADRVRVLYGQGDTLWAGSDAGGLVGWDVTDRSFVQLLYPQDKLAGNTVTAVATAADGTLWVTTTGGVSRYPPDGQGENLTFKNSSQRAGQRAALQERAVTGQREVRLQDITTRSDAESAFAPGYLMFGTDQTIYFYRDWDETDGTVVISPGLRRTVEPGTPVYAVDVGLAADDVRDVAIDHAGRVWLSTVNGVSVYDGEDWTVYTKPYVPLVSNDAGIMAVDAAGRVWISHQERGQFTMYDGGWHQYSIDGAIQGLAVHPGDGSVWAATSLLCPPSEACFGGGAWAFDGGAWRLQYDSDDGIFDNEVDKIAFGANGEIWLGHELFDRVAVSRWTGANWITYQTVREAIEADFGAVATTVTTADLWVVVAGRVWTRHLGAVRGYAPASGWQALYTSDEVLNSNNVRALAADDAGRVWVGVESGFDGKTSRGGGINVWDSGQWTHYTAENSNLADNMVSAIAVGRDRVWVKTRTAYNRFLDGTWTAYSELTELVETDYWRILDAQDLSSINSNPLWTVDDADRVWIQRNEGVSYYKPDTGWVTYTSESTRRQGEVETYTLQATAAGEQRLWVAATDIPDSAAAQSHFANGYLMVGDDPTIYRYESFLSHSRSDVSGIQVSPQLENDVAENTPVYSIELGLLTNRVNDIVVGPDGRMWFAIHPERLNSTNAYGGVSVLDVGSDTWEQYTVQGTSRRGEIVAQTTADVNIQAMRVPSNFGSDSAAEEALSSGFVMFEDDLTLYRYLGFNDGEIAVKPIFSSSKYEVGVQQALPAGAAIYRVEMGILGTPGADSYASGLAVDHRGRMWISIAGVGISILDDAEQWSRFRRADDGLASVRIADMLVRGGEVWVPTEEAGVSIFRDGVWRTYNVFNSGLADNQIEALAFTLDGKVWLGTYDGGISGLTLPGFRFDGGMDSVLVVPGETADVAYDVVPVGGFNDSVALTVEGLPPGVDATFTPDTINGGGRVMLTVDVSPFVAPGSYPLTVSGRSPDNLTTKRRLTLHVVSFLQQMHLPLVTR